MLDDLVDEIDHILPDVLAGTGTPGVAVAVATVDEIRTTAAGHADLARGRPMTATGTAMSGSLSKPLLGLALMRERTSGALDIEAPVDRYLPAGIRPPNPYDPRPVSAAMLASHQGGYRVDTIEAMLDRPGPIGEHITARHAIGHTPEYGGVAPLYTRTGVYSYSSFGITVLANAVETVTGERYDEYVARTILKPAGMTNSALPPGTPTPTHWDDLVGSGVTGYMAFGDWCVPTPTLHTGIYPAAGLITSPADYVRLLQKLLRVPHGDEDLITPAALNGMLAPRIERASPVTRNSYAGIAVELGDPALGPAWWWGHSAAYNWGWWWDSRVYPHHGVAVVTLANRWDMMRYYNPADRNAAGVIAQWTGDWLTSGGTCPPPAIPSREPTGSPTSRESSWIGAVLADRIHGTLGIPTPLPRAMVTSMAEDARAITTESTWDLASFLTTFDEVAALSPDPTALAAYARGTDPAAGAWALRCGAGTKKLPMPVDGFAFPRLSE